MCVPLIDQNAFVLMETTYGHDAKFTFHSELYYAIIHKGRVKYGHETMVVVTV